MLAIQAGLLIAVIGVGLLAHQVRWAIVGNAGGALSLAPFGLFFGPWWLLAIAISTALGVVARRELIAA